MRLYLPSLWTEWGLLPLDPAGPHPPAGGPAQRCCREAKKLYGGVWGLELHRGVETRGSSQPSVVEDRVRVEGRHMGTLGVSWGQSEWGANELIC